MSFEVRVQGHSGYGHLMLLRPCSFCTRTYFERHSGQVECLGALIPERAEGSLPLHVRLAGLLNSKQMQHFSSITQPIRHPLQTMALSLLDHMVWSHTLHLYRVKPLTVLGCGTGM